MRYGKVLVVMAGLLLCFNANASKLFIPMDDESQKNHLKAYGVAFAALKMGVEVDWLLNYKGGSFSMDQVDAVERLCKLRGVDYEVMSDAQYSGIVTTIINPDYNGDIIKLEKPPKVAVYTPDNKLPWDDAVTMVLTYAVIPYDKVYDDQVLEVKLQEATAAKHNFKKVSKLKLTVAQKIRDFVSGGGYLFAMCSATDSYDIGLASHKTDICDVPFDGDPQAPDPQSQLDYSQCLAFKDFTLKTSPYEYEFSNIDVTNTRRVPMPQDYFTLFTFSAKFDPVPTMLCQNHTTTIKGFMGQTTAFNKSVLKTSVLVMGEYKPSNEARYIHGEYGKGTWTFYGGHDPEDYQHQIGDPPTELEVHPTSPGYRLILNNVLFPAAKKKPRKT